MVAQSIKIAIIYFSPTGGGKKIALAIKESFLNADIIDITKSAIRLERTNYSNFDLIFFIAPTYAQSLPKIIKQYLKTIKFSRYFVPITIYGNISYGSSIKLMAKLARKKGTVIIGGAAFVGAHSYNNPSQRLSIAINRPDKEDLNEVASFCSLIKVRLNSDKEKIHFTGIRNPLACLIPERLANLAAVKPKIQKAKCTNCNICQQNCPADAINEILKINSKCIRCYSCSANCPAQARMKKIRFPLTKIYLKFFGKKRRSNKFF